MDTRTDKPQSKVDEETESSRADVNLGQPDPDLLGGDAGEPMERGPGQESQPDKPIRPTDRDQTGGITNRPLSEKEHDRRKVPPR